MSISLLNTDFNNIKDMSFSLLNIQDTLTNTVVNTIDVAADTVVNTINPINSVINKVLDCLNHIKFIISSYGTMIAYLHGNDIFNVLQGLAINNDILGFMKYLFVIYWEYYFTPFVEILSLPFNPQNLFDYSLIKTVISFCDGLFNEGKDIYLNFVTTTRLDHTNEALKILFDVKNDNNSHGYNHYWKEVKNDSDDNASDTTVKGEPVASSILYNDFELKVPQNVLNSLKEENTNFSSSEEILSKLKLNNDFEKLFNSYLDKNSLLTRDSLDKFYDISIDFEASKDINIKISLLERLYNATIGHYGFWLATSSTLYCCFCYSSKIDN